MCGYLISNLKTSEKKFSEALATLAHRGPDNTSVSESDGWRYGHVRLSLFDLSPNSNQPVELDCSGSRFVFNGEIFNYQEFGSCVSDTLMLKERFLELKGDLNLIDSFKSLLNQLNGFFSIAVKIDHRVYFIRDRFGEKPLYLFVKNNNIIGASEIKAIRALIDVQISSIELYRLSNDPFDFAVGSLGADLYKTAYENVYELRPGCLAVYDIKENKISTHEWYSLRDDIEKYKSYNPTDLYIDSLRLRLKSDAKGAFTLSGGVDSSANCLVSKRIIGSEVSAFSVISSHSEYSESASIEKNKEKLVNKHYSIFEEEILQDLTAEKVFELIRHFDYPYFDPNIVQYSLYNSIREAGYKFVIDGHGADELLSGYQWHQPHLAYHAFRNSNVLMAMQVTSYFFKSYPKNYSFIYKAAVYSKGILQAISGSRNMNYFGHNPKKESNIRFQELFSRVLLRLLNNYDMTSMKSSIEVRTPYMDYRLVACILSQKNEFFCGEANKPWLRNLIRHNSDIEIMTKKVGLRSYLWKSMKPQEVKLIYDKYTEAIKDINSIVGTTNTTQAIPMCDMNSLSPSKEHDFWKVLSFKVLKDAV